MLIQISNDDLIFLLAISQIDKKLTISSSMCNKKSVLRATNPDCKLISAILLAFICDNLNKFIYYCAKISAYLSC